jgi:hypothetical protein
MDPETASVVLAAITAVGAVVWLAGLQFLIRSHPRRQFGEQPDSAEAVRADECPEGWFCGSADVEGESRALATRAAALLANSTPLTFGPVKILEKTDRDIRFERVEVGQANQPPAQWFRRGELRFTPLRSGRTRVAWAVEPANVRWLLWLAAGFQVGGLLVLVVGCWGLATFVVPSPDPAIRWQTIQMVQVVHFLWPPFLFGGLYRRGSRAVAGQFEALAHNLPYHDG